MIFYGNTEKGLVWSGGTEYERIKAVKSVWRVLVYWLLIIARGSWYIDLTSLSVICYIS